jgi:hypothetical protein
LFRKRSDRSGGGIQFAIVLSNGNTLLPTREAGVVQIADALIELSREESRISEYGQSAPYGHTAAERLDLAIESFHSSGKIGLHRAAGQ